MRGAESSQIFNNWHHLYNIQRINVIGTSGSGKSTFSKKLAEILNCRHIEIDQLYWRPNWQEAPEDEFLSSLEEALKAEKWVLDGNYTRTTPVKWRNVQMVIWLDYSFPKILTRVVKRAIQRSITKEDLWNTGNRESLLRAISKDSIIWWSIKTYKPNKIKYELTIKDENYNHIQFARLKSPKEADRFLKDLLEFQALQ
jgi:adenylate kinase family enzyme